MEDITDDKKILTDRTRTISKDDQPHIAQRGLD